MGLPKLKKFLCCISLETGGLIVGWFNVIFSFLALFAVITLLSLEVAGHGNNNNDNQGVIGGFFGEIRKFGESCRSNEGEFSSFGLLLLDLHHLLLDNPDGFGMAHSRNESGKSTTVLAS